MKMQNNKADKKTIAISIFMLILTITMPIVFTALQPEIQGNEIKQNSSLDFISNFIKKIFSSIDIIPNVSAEETPDPGNEMGCCPETKTGARFQSTTEDECAYTACQQGQAGNCWRRNQTCPLGCCITSSGMCLQNSFAESCNSANSFGSFIPNDANCIQSPLCQRGCCTKGMETFMSTNFTCHLKNGVWDSSITSELNCLSKTEKETLGCCKSFAGYEYLTRQECTESRLGTFFSGKKCYDKASVPGTPCIEETNPALGKCLEGFPNKYKNDSCGNIYIDELKESCSGFCEMKTNSCKGGECTQTYRSHTTTVGANTATIDYFEKGPRQTNIKANNGEAWCVYDTKFDVPTPYNTEPGQSTMGSRYWRHYCLYGKDYVEPCADYRQQICIEDKANGLNYAACTDNMWAKCLNITDETECNEEQMCFWWTIFQSNIYSGDEIIAKKGRLSTPAEIENWVVFGTKKEGMPLAPVCLPRYPPGLDDGTNGFQNKEEVCNMGGYICQYKQSFWGLDTANPECVEGGDELYTYMAHRCMSLGDCGTWINYLGKQTNGYTVIQFDEKPNESNSNQARGKRELGVPEPYQNFLKSTINNFNAKKSWSVPITNWRDGGLLAIISGLVGGTAVVWGGAAIFAVTMAGGIGLTGIAAGGVIAAGTTLVAGSALAAGSSLAAGTITSGSVVLATVAGETIVTATAASPIVITATSTGVSVTGGTAGGLTVAGTGATAGAGGATAGATGATVGSGGATAGAAGATAAGVSVAAIVAGALMVVAGIALIWIGFTKDPGFEQGAYMALGAGLIAAGTALIIAGASQAWNPTGWVIAGIGAAMLAITALLYWVSYDEKYYQVQCNPTTPPSGSTDCEKCNSDSMRPCSKYRCESLGTACEFVDKINISGQTFALADGQCIATTNSGKAPYITKIQVFDMQGNEVFKLPSSGNILASYPSSINIKANNQEIASGTTLKMKLTMNEKSICKWDVYPSLNFTGMNFPFDSTVLRKELSQEFVITQLAPYVYVRCANAYGNANVAEYVFKFEAKTGPDMSPPEILSTDRDYYNKFANGTTELPLFIYVSEDARCRWAKEEREYSSMSELTQCKTELGLQGYKCSTKLTELSSEIINTFYLRCNDTSGNFNQESYLLQLNPTPSLQITNIIPEDKSKISGCSVSSKTTITVETAEGAEAGIATCYWTRLPEYARLTKFTSTGNNVHTTEIESNQGMNTIYIQCSDSALNYVRNSTSFEIYSDNDAPIITRFYKQGSELVLQTNEPAKCSYHFNFGKKVNTCSFVANDSLYSKEFSTTGSLEHQTGWDESEWNIKCYDECFNGNKLTDACTVIIPSAIE